MAVVVGGAGTFGARLVRGLLDHTDMHVVVAGKHAVVFWADHAAKEVKVLDLRPAGR